MPETTHTPAGNYPASRPVHHIDLDAKANELLGALGGRGRKTESLAREAGISLLLMAMEPGDRLDQHSADGVVTVQLLQGHAVLETDEGRVDLHPQEVVLFQPGIRHDIRAEERSAVLLTVTGGEA